MRSQAGSGKTPAADRTAQTRTPPSAGGVPPTGLLAQQRSTGNAAVVQMLRAAGHLPSQDRHEHGEGCGHEQAGQAGQAAPAPVQRSAVHGVLRGAGRPLDRATRTDMEGRLGADFSDVRIHNDAAAKASAAEIGARAYTSGSHVVIGNGGNDKHTLAHELTHVIQQRQGQVAGTDTGDGLKVSDPSDRFEREAEANATRVMRRASGSSEAAPPTATDTNSAQDGTKAVQRASSTTTETAEVNRYQPSKPGAPSLRDLRVKRPLTVRGAIQPTGTSGRGSAPEPLSVTSLQSAYKDALKQHHATAGTRVPKGTTPNNATVWKDLFGGAGYDRGHIMGLEVGGSDVADNIVPQWSLNQQSGEWREIEKNLVALGSGQVTFTPHYPADYGNYRAVMIPTSVDVQIQGGSGVTWQNDPNLNDLFRSGQDPESPAESYQYAKDSRHGKGSITVDEGQMHVLAATAHMYDKVVSETHNDYVNQTNSGQTPGPSTFDSLMQKVNVSSVPKGTREKLIDVYIQCGWVTKSGANYIIDDPSFADYSSSSESGTESESGSGSDTDVSMGSAGSFVANVPFSQIKLGNDSGSDSDYMSE
ncbi:DUF4157 domain-containing protein [Streptomyces sp. NPDC091289]|uniref:eCIS core domain-containing protein n=1 Tax=Streptomyces sp. NPDC091289 TaxID=3365989 RepID=UPI0037FA6C9D